ncbi:MAG: alpha/beta hydrolase [Micropepsaceae bacterium]
MSRDLGAGQVQIIYCHGVPGSESDLRAAGLDSESMKRIAVLDRMAATTDTFEETFLAAFDSMRSVRNEAVFVVGFSLGAMCALRLAACRPEHVKGLALISPAAPLELGSFLPAMAGRTVFRAAINGSASLRLLTIAQRMIVATFPVSMIRMLFAACADSDRVLLQDSNFITALKDGLRYCLLLHPSAYRREIDAFVKPWANEISRVKCPVTIWQGTKDTWTPPAMAVAIRAKLGETARLHLCDGLGHYATLRFALPLVLNDVSDVRQADRAAREQEWRSTMTQ